MKSHILVAAILLGVSAMAAAATPDLAKGSATLTVGQGTVLVNDGSQYVTARPGQKLKAGDRVMVMDGGSATLTFADGRKATVPSGSLYSVTMATPATQAMEPTKKVGSMYAQAVGDSSGSNSNSDSNKDVGMFVLGGIGLAAVVAALSAGGGNHGGHGNSISQP